MNEFPTEYGVFTVSLDFELYWGVRDKRTLESYRENLLGVRKAIPALLDLFREYEIHATWATVGFLFFEKKDELLASVPTVKPAYAAAELSPYPHLADVGQDEISDPYHFAPSLLRNIVEVPHQEIGTHTLSHYYCLEPGQNAEAFAADLEKAVGLGPRCGQKIESLVFPRNQVNEAYLSLCSEKGIRAVRGNPRSWLHSAADSANVSPFRRALRLMDHYLPVSGRATYRVPREKGVAPVDVRASRFLRPYSRRLKAFDSLRYRRLAAEMREAAYAKKIFHLWWHPHNFGKDLENNLAFLRRLLEQYRWLSQNVGMKSFSMGEIARSAAV